MTLLSIPFPHAVLTKIEGQPDPRKLLPLRRELMANLSCVTSDKYETGYIGEVLTDVEFSALNGEDEAYEPPEHPGEPPSHLPRDTAATIANKNSAWQVKSDEYERYKKVTNATRSQLIAAIEPTYLAELQHPVFGLAQTTVASIYEFLTESYATLTPEEVEANRISLQQTWAPNTPFQGLWNKAKSVRDVASIVDEPIGELQAISSMLTALQPNYSVAVTDWYKQPAGQRGTIRQFKTFMKIYEDMPSNVLTTPAAGQGYQANAATTTTTPAPALANTVSYCWTHGVCRDLTHNSRTCTNRKPNHVETAELFNRQGGDNYIYDRGQRGGRNQQRSNRG